MEEIFEEYFSDVKKDFNGTQTVKGLDIQSNRVKNEAGIEYFEMKVIDKKANSSEYFLFERVSVDSQNVNQTFLRTLLPNKDELLGNVFTTNAEDVCITVRLDFSKNEDFLPLSETSFRSPDEIMKFVRHCILPIHAVHNRNVPKTNQLALKIEESFKNIERVYAFGRSSNSLEHNKLCNLIEKYLLNPSTNSPNFKRDLEDFKHPLFVSTTDSPRVLSLFHNGFSQLFLKKENLFIGDYESECLTTIGLDLTTLILDGNSTRNYFVEIISQLAKDYEKFLNLKTDDFMEDIQLGCLLFMIIRASKINCDDRIALISTLNLFCCGAKIFF